MSVQDHRSLPRDGVRNRTEQIGSALSPGLRWLAGVIWWIEHGFERARAKARPEEDTRVRIFMVMGLFGLVFTVLALGAVRASLFVEKGAGGRLESSQVLDRADLVDRNGQLLATNVTYYNLFIDPREVWDREAAIRAIKRVLPGVSSTRLAKVMAGDRRLIVDRGLSPGERAAVHGLALGGLTFEPMDRRVYPLMGSAAHVIGVSDTGGQGISGSELAFNDAIRNAGAGGEDFALSIDLRIQGVVENELAVAAERTGAKGAIAIVTDVQTGEVLGMASWPTFNPNERGSADDNAVLNRVTSGHYEMGSVFKTFTVAAGLDTGLADMDTRFDASQALVVGNRRIKDFHATNQVLTLEEVYLHSSNIGTSRLAIEMGSRVMRDYFGRMGLLEAAPIELKESARPIVPGKWDNSTLASLSFGYAIAITPAQAVAAMGALTNGGRYVPLSLRRGGSGQAGRQIVTAETSATILDLMRRNVVRGSGGFADVPGLRVGGKTGSANKLVNGRYNPSHAVGSFAAVFPADGPVTAKRYAIFVLVDEPSSYPKTGAYVAAPTVHNIAERIAPFLGVERRADRWRTITGEKIPQADDTGAGH